MSDDQDQMSFIHREGCIWGDDMTHAHRVPIDCTTVEDLLEENAELHEAIRTLKCRVYDLEYGND